MSTPLGEALRSTFYAIQLKHSTLTTATKFLTDMWGKILVWTDKSRIEEILYQIEFEVNNKGNYRAFCSIIDVSKEKIKFHNTRLCETLVL
jgi:hypothetical protein